ncbi:MAG: ABC transporter permease [Chitinispirillaceae bacterium]|nr:ABC transporter permease [Chitinispirillaceae bacterium]
MIRNIIIVTLHDVAIAFKNKTIYLILFVPFFVFFSLKLVDKTDADFKKSTLGLLQKEKYDTVVLQAVASAGRVFTVIHVSDEEEGKRWLIDKKIDGLLVRSENGKNSLVLVVLKKESMVTLSMVESFSALQKAVEGNGSNWISAVMPLQGGGIQKNILPTWILMMVLLVSFIIVPAQVAEEKEKKILLALLQTPMREIEWLIAKVLSGIFLILIAVLLLHILGNFDFGNVVSYIAFVGVGSFCFSSYGILLGFLCRNAASARTLGVIFYLPHLLPSALSDFSQKLAAVAPLLPSYQFYEPVKSILLEEGRISVVSMEWIYLLLVGIGTFSLALLLMKKRWLM